VPSVILALDYREGSRRVGKVRGTDLEREITKIVRVTGHGNLENKGWRVVRIFDIVVSREKFPSPPCPYNSTTATTIATLAVVQAKLTVDLGYL
jgi:hypothetical protein